MFEQSKISMTVRVLQALAILNALGWIAFALFTWNPDMYISGTELRQSHIILIFAAIWLLSTIGIVSLRRWGWVLLLGMFLFSILEVINLIIARPWANISLVVLVCLVGTLFTWLMTRESIYNAYNVSQKATKNVPEILRLFSLLLMVSGAFILFEMLTGFRIGPSTEMVRLFSAGAGLTYFVLGIGLWNYKKLALEACEPILLFTLIALGFAFFKDYFDGTKSYNLIQSVFIFTVAIGIMLYWIMKVRKSIEQKRT